MVPSGPETRLIILAGVNVALQLPPLEKAITLGSLIAFIMLSSAFRMYVYFGDPM